jgi:flavodoxin
MKVLVAYESQGGITMRTANALAESARGGGHDATARPLREVGGADLVGVDLLIVGTWVEGFVVARVGPAKAARRWVAGLPELAGVPTAVFCTYAFHPKGTLGQLSTMLEARGARVVAEKAFHHRRPEVGAEAFVRAAVTGANATLGG